MNTTKTYRIELKGIDPSDLVAVAKLIEENAFVFESTVLSAFNDNASYTFISNLFEVINIDDSYFEYEAQYQYFEGCKGKDFNGTHEDSVDYEIKDGYLVFELDELAWDVR